MSQQTIEKGIAFECLILVAACKFLLHDLICVLTLHWSTLELSVFFFIELLNQCKLLLSLCFLPTRIFRPIHDRLHNVVSFARWAQIFDNVPKTTWIHTRYRNFTWLSKLWADFYLFGAFWALSCVTATCDASLCHELHRGRDPSSVRSLHTSCKGIFATLALILILDRAILPSDTHHEKVWVLFVIRRCYLGLWVKITLSYRPCAQFFSRWKYLSFICVLCIKLRLFHLVWQTSRLHQCSRSKKQLFLCHCIVVFSCSVLLFISTISRVDISLMDLLLRVIKVVFSHRGGRSSIIHDSWPSWILAGSAGLWCSYLNVRRSPLPA